MTTWFNTVKINERLKADGVYYDFRTFEYRKIEKPIPSIYTSWSQEYMPKHLATFYECTPNGFGSDTFRTRFQVKCLRCQKIIHHSTTWPTHYIKDHELECTADPKDY